MKYRFLVAGLLTATAILAGPSALADGWISCAVEGEAETYSIRKVVIDRYATMNLRIEITHPYPTTTEPGDHHTFGGVWILRGDRMGLHSYNFIDTSYMLGPAYYRLDAGTLQTGGRLPYTGVVREGVQGKWAAPSQIDPGTYHIVAFGSGGGSYKASLNFLPTGGEGEMSCIPVDWPGAVESFDASAFVEGTQVVSPGHGVVQNGKLRFSNTFTNILGALYFYEPEPFPKPQLHISVERGSVTKSQVIESLYWGSFNYDLTGSFTGKTDTILLSLLKIDLPCDPTRPCNSGLR